MHLTLACVILALAFASGPPSPSPPTFPEQALGWRLAERTTYHRSNLFDFIDGGAEVYLAYGFRRLEVALFRRPDKPELVAEAYDMSSGEDAYGVLSLDLTGEAVPVGAVGRYGAGLLRFCKGRWFVRVMGQQETRATRAAVMAIGKQLAQSLPGETRLPELVRLLPREGLQPDSATFFHTRVTLNQLYYLADQNLLGLGPDTEAVMADYRVGKDETKLLVARYPDERRCLAARTAFLTGYLGRAGAGDLQGSPVGRTPEGAQVERVEGGKFAGVQAEPPYLILALEAPAAEAARALLAKSAERLRRSKDDG